MLVEIWPNCNGVWLDWAVWTCFREKCLRGHVLGLERKVASVRCNDKSLYYMSSVKHLNVYQGRRSRGRISSFICCFVFRKVEFLNVVSWGVGNFEAKYDPFCFTDLESLSPPTQTRFQSWRKAWLPFPGRFCNCLTLSGPFLRLCISNSFEGESEQFSIF